MAGVEYLFDKNWLRIRDAQGDIAIKGWNGPQALRRGIGEADWHTFIPNNRLILPYRKSPKKKRSKPPEPTNQMAFDFFNESAEPVVEPER
ncbi:MAG: hypothetical protein AAF226_18930, partial [Verrucomicrobiota bacterium]